jgi:hypothetical protein
MLDHPPVAAGSSMVKLIYDDVVEPVRLELVQVSRECLDTGEHDAGARLLGPAVVQAEIRIWLYLAEHLKGLPQDLLAMSNEQHASDLRSGSVERCEPRLAEPSRHDDQAAAESLQTGLLQGVKRLALHRSRGGRSGRWFGHHACCVCAGLPAQSVVSKQLMSEWLAARIGPQPLEGR